MRAFVVFAAIFAVALARPDVSHLQGYQYNQPSSGGHSHGGSHSSGGNNFGGGSSGGGYSGGGSSGGGYSGGGSSGGFSSGGGGGSSGGFSSGGGSFGSGGGGGGGGGSNEIQKGETQVIDLTGGSSGGGGGVRAVYTEGAPEITKSFFIHEAPEEQQQGQAQEKRIEIRPKKHYKIIFVKVPGAGGAAGGGSVPVFPQNEEKTIVYVLSKKSEFGGENGEFPTPPPPVTTKPEVFFIKYNNQADSDTVVNKIQESFQEGGAGYNSPGAFAQSIGALGGGSASQSSSGGFSSGGGSSGGSQSFGGSSGGSQSFGGSSGGSQSFGGSSGGGYSSGGNSFIEPQQMIQISSEHSVFNSEYLPPNRRF